MTARRQCPDLIFVKPRFDVYKAISQEIRDIFAEHTLIIAEFDAMIGELQPLVDKVWLHCESIGIRCRTITRK